MTEHDLFWLLIIICSISIYTHHFTNINLSFGNIKYMMFFMENEKVPPHLNRLAAESMNEYQLQASLVSNDIDPNISAIAIENAAGNGVLLGRNAVMRNRDCNLFTMDIGRLGNYIFTYITEFLLSQQFNIQPCISKVGY